MRVRRTVRKAEKRCESVAIRSTVCVLARRADGRPALARPNAALWPRGGVAGLARAGLTLS